MEFEANAAGTGAFGYTEERYGPLLGQFNDILDQHETGRLDDTIYVAALQRMLAEAPDFLDAHTQLAFHWLRQGNPAKALDIALQGLALANRAIPAGYAGRIEWVDIDNRAYLRLTHAAVLGYVRLRRHKDAAALCEQMLLRNPNDNQGVRYLLGSEALRAGQHERAIEIFAAHAEAFPPYWYDLALAHLQGGRFVAAATALRHGFASNPYIAEILGGNPAPAPFVLWHPDDTTLPDAARDYVAMYGPLWRERPDGTPFVRWLFNHPEVMIERASFMACREALLWENDQGRREEILARLEELADRIDDTLSAAIVVQRQALGRQLVWPWQLQLDILP
ncbi:tetratricopeptide repeat protein [Pseudoduganella lutea]|uniref:Tetratricopeptide repeat protein n=1 Tax=Pseudoduganella lutea TaxID=321985 RepID=A0A4P6L055_9BURK|nr:tetratricopeptide repeat protein [Pseudoduganella lutea]QBE64627.1 tetratricopeptide repeat protein [Pseudoduganella lutea]